MRGCLATASENMEQDEPKDSGNAGSSKDGQETEVGEHTGDWE